MTRHRQLVLAIPLVAASLTACGGDSGGTGTAILFAESEDTITGGLKPGTDLENVKDGWTVAYTKFVIALGNVRVSKSGNAGAALTDPRVQVVDLRALPQTGLILAKWNGIADGRWDKVAYDQAYASASSVQGAGTSKADFDAMVAAGSSLWVAGTITKDGRTISFDWPLKAGVSWSDCGPEMGDKGFAVPAGGTAQVKATIHGDHWFFNNFPEGEELTSRLAGWIAAVDDVTGKDGKVTVDDLKAAPAAMVLPAGTFSLANPLGETITTAYEFVVTQARTIGHLQGEGECSTVTKL